MNDTNNNNQNGIGSGLGSALQNIRLKKVASTDHNGEHPIYMACGFEK